MGNIFIFFECYCKNMQGISKLLNPESEIYSMCNCPKTWKNNGHHLTCIRSKTCIFCLMEKNTCGLLGICKGKTSFKENSRTIEAEQTIRNDIFNNLKASLKRLFYQIAVLQEQIDSSEKKKSCLRRVFNCRSQYETMKQMQNVSDADIDSAEKCLYKLKCAYFDIKTMDKKSASEN
jgi:hypothetical protein